MNTALDYFLFFAAVWGISSGIAFSKLTSPFVELLQALGQKWPIAKFFGQLFSCPMCIGFHVAWIACLAEYSPEPPTLFHAVRLAFICAGINLVLAVTTEKLAS